MKFFEKKPTLFTKNRHRFLKQMGAKSFALFQANDELISNGDALYPYQPNSDLYWLTGIVQDQTKLLLCPDYPDKNYREILFISDYNPLKEKWDGARLTPQKASELSGIKTVLPLSSFSTLLTKLAHENETIFLNTNENDRKPNYIPTSDYRLIQEIKSLFPLHHFKRSAPILKALRSIKTKEEIALMQKAIDITHHTFLRILEYLQPDRGEYEIEGEILRCFYNQKANGAAYGSIIASGKNACVLHYIENNQTCKDGDLVLMDFGATYSGYCADLTRTIPVNGKFSPRQKAIYNACLSIHLYAKSILKPGITLATYTEKVGEHATQSFLKLGLLSKTEVKNQDPKNPAYRKYLYHGISHHLGIDVHDLGESLPPVREGMVFTIEPGIYVEEEGIGIRIENNVWLTERGNIDLMKHIPIQADDIERLMKKAK